MSNHHKPPTVPGMSRESSEKLYPILQERLVALIDMQLTLKQAHWNVIGPDFIAVHEMLDEHVTAVRAMSDDVAERLRTLGGEPIGTSGYVAENRTWDDYKLGRASVPAHLAEIDSAYNGLISDHRIAIGQSGDDPVTEDLFIGQAATLELNQWFVRSFLEHAGS